jgi:hypothetical protein
MLDRSLALRLNGPWAASSEDGPRRSSFHKAGRERKTQDARALFLTTRLEERAEFSGSSPIALSSAHQRRDIAKFFSRSHDALSRVYDDAAGSVIETHEHAGDFKEPQCTCHVAETIPLRKCRMTRHNSRRAAFNRFPSPQRQECPLSLLPYRPSPQKPERQIAH